MPERCPKGTRKNKKTGLCEPSQKAAPVVTTKTLPQAGLINESIITDKTNSIKGEIELLKLKNKSLEEEKSITTLMIQKNTDKIKALEKELDTMDKIKKIEMKKTTSPKAKVTKANITKKVAAPKPAAPKTVAPKPAAPMTVAPKPAAPKPAAPKPASTTGQFAPYTTEANDKTLVGTDGVRTGPMKSETVGSNKFYYTLIEGLGNKVYLVSKTRDGKTPVEAMIVMDDELQDYIQKNADVGDEVSISAYSDFIEDTEDDYEDDLTSAGKMNLQKIKDHKNRRAYFFDQNWFDGETHRYLGSNSNSLIEDVLSTMAKQF